MLLDIIVLRSDDGFTAEAPLLKGCETWAANEEEVLEKIVALAKYYLKLDDSAPLHLDKARGNFNKKNYKLIFNKG